MPEIKFSNVHSRNGHDFHYDCDPTGRHVLVANHKGVKTRIGLLVTALGKHDSLTKEGMVDYLVANFHDSYTVNDMAQPIKHMLAASIISQHGSGRGTYYTLTRKGKDTWKNASKVWLGK